MRDPARIARIMGKLRHLWHDNPDMRLGQLVMNLTRNENGDTEANRAFNIEDDDLEIEIEDTLKGNWT